MIRLLALTSPLRADVLLAAQVLTADRPARQQLDVPPRVESDHS